MKRIINTAVCLGLIVASQAALADPLQPIPAAPGSEFSTIVEHHAYDGPIHMDVAPEPLFTNVKYVDKREMHPCAVTKIIRVNAPRACNDPCDSCCGPKCVYIKICIPPCGCETVICRRQGNRIRYDYGKYVVDVRVKKNRIVVDYQK